MILIVIASIAFVSPLGAINGVYAQTKTQDITSPGAAVGKAAGAAASCFLTVYLMQLAKEPVDQAIAAGKAAGKSPSGGPLLVNPPATTWAAESTAERQKTNVALTDSQKCWRDTVIKILGDYIVDQTITWIQGGGKPRFVQDWRSFLKDAANAGVGEVIRESNAAALCSPFKLQVKVSLFPVTRFKQKIDCTLDGIVGNINNFMNDFRSGGWIGYGSLWSPNNNYFGQMLLTYDEAAKRSAEKQTAAKNEAVAGAGFLSANKCVQKDQIEVNNCLKECRSTTFDSVSGEASFTNNCGEGDPRTFCEAQASCAKYENQTPGSVVAGMTVDALGWDLKYLPSMQSWIAALSNAVVNRLITQGLSYMGANNPPDTNVAEMTASANEAVSSQDLSAAIRQLFDNIKGIKAAVINNEQAISDTKTKSLSNMQEVYKIYLACSGIPAGAATTASSTASQIHEDIKKITDSYLSLSSEFQIDVDSLLSQAISSSAASFNAKYNDFVTEYRDPISDVNSQTGQFDANKELEETRMEFKKALTFTHGNETCQPDEFMSAPQ